MSVYTLFNGCSWFIGNILPVVVTLVFVWFRKYQSRNFPKGPIGLPLAGYLPFLGKSPPDTLKKLSKDYGNIYSIKLGSHDFVILSKYEDIYEAFVKRSAVFSGRHVPSTLRDFGAQNGIIFRSYDDTWKYMRKFGIKNLKGFGVGKRSMEDRVNEEIRLLRDTINSENGKSFDVQERLSLAAANVICSIVTGERHDGNDKEFMKMLALLSERLNGQSTARKLSMIEYFPLLKFLPVFKDTYKKFRNHVLFTIEMLQRVIDKHEDSFDENDTRDVIDAYLKELNDRKEGSHLKKSYLPTVIRDLFNAGTETTTTTLRWCFLYLAKNQDVQQSIKREINSVLGQNGPISMGIREQMPLTCSFIHEIQRTRPIIPLISRATTESADLKGFWLPKHTPVIANIWQCHYDPETFENPDVFNPRRFLNGQGKFEKHNCVMPYGIGLRYCLGKHLAEMEVFMFLTEIVRSFRLEEDPKSPLPSFDEKVVGLVQSPPPYKLRFVQ